TAAFARNSGQLFVGTNTGLLIGHKDASGNPTAFTAASGTTDLIKKIVTVVDPQNSADVVFAATQADVYVLSGTSLVSIGGPLPKTGTGIQIQDIAGASNSQKYVLYATVTRKPDTSQTSGWSIPVWRYAKVGTS